MPPKRKPTVSLVKEGDASTSSPELKSKKSHTLQNPRSEKENARSPEEAANDKYAPNLAALQKDMNSMFDAFRSLTADMQDIKMALRTITAAEHGATHSEPPVHEGHNRSSVVVPRASSDKFSPSPLLSPLPTRKCACGLQLQLKRYCEGIHKGVEYWVCKDPKCQPNKQSVPESSRSPLISVVAHPPVASIMSLSNPQELQRIVEQKNEHKAMIEKLVEQSMKEWEPDLVLLFRESQFLDCKLLENFVVQNSPPEVVSNGSFMKLIKTRITFWFNKKRSRFSEGIRKWAIKKIPMGEDGAWTEDQVQEAVESVTQNWVGGEPSIEELEKGRAILRAVKS